MQHCGQETPPVGGVLMSYLKSEHRASNFIDATPFMVTLTYFVGRVLIKPAEVVIERLLKR